MNEYPFTHNQAEHRFELDLLDGTTALACYVVRADGAVLLTHTDVPHRVGPDAHRPAHGGGHLALVHQLVHHQKQRGHDGVGRADGAVIFTHPEVPPRHEGQGIGSQLLARTLAALRADGRRIVPQCSFAVAYVNRHPEWQELLADR